MPASLSIIPISSLKKYKLTFLFFLFPLFFYGQSLTGLWTGTLSNDSTTIRKDQLFEIVLTEYRGKVYGYSRSEFIVNDTLYYIVKRVKGTITGDICEVVDDDIISFNFRGRLDKGVKVTSTFKRNSSDSSWYLDGTWKTNATKKYYSVTGKVGLENEKDLSKSKIFPHLEELNLAKEVAFYKDREETTPVITMAKPEKVRTEYNVSSVQMDSMSLAKLAVKSIDIAPTEGQMIMVTDSNVEKLENNTIVTGVKKSEMTTEKISAKPQLEIKGDERLTTLARQQEEQRKKEELKRQEDLRKQDELRKSTAQVKTTPKQETIAKTTVPAEVKKPVQEKPKVTETVRPAVEPEKKPVIAAIEKPGPVVPSKTKEELIQQVAVLGGRKSEFSQEVNFKSDSLELYLYDNGEIDGDTVSVYMNGDMIMAKQGLKASALKKTIYIKAGQQEDFTIVLYADNLGKYPPNTGLLVVHDGEDIYHLRFSSDFQKSTGIVFRKKK